VALERILGFLQDLLPWAVGAAIAATAYRLVPRLAPIVRILPGRPRVRIPREPVPEAWREIVARNVPLAARLPADAREHLLRLVQVFLDEKPMEGVALDLTDEMRVTIAALACLPLVALEYPRYPTLRRILVYPGVFQPRRVEMARLGEIYREPPATLGEAWSGGIVVLSWESSLGGSLDPDDGQNVVLHEFAHVLDGENGAMDGVPVLERSAAVRRWNAVIGALYERQVDAVLAGAETPIHPYAATNRAEYFAVATETFFERPLDLERALPELYVLLRDFYRQDPAALARRASDWGAAGAADWVAG
jgi:Mlc titration factor MtfA (ptsG expression regulator)